MKALGLRLVLAALLLGCGCLSVQAEVWGYVDDKGVAHFAAEKIDARYELFFRGGNRMLAVPVQTGTGFVAGNPVELFDERAYGRLLRGSVPMGSYDVTADGRHFLMIKALPPAPTQINVVVNWFEELKRLVPTN